MSHPVILRTLICAAAVCGIVVTANSVQGAPITIVDQEYFPGDFPNLQASTSVIGRAGQSFTPMLSSLDAVEMHMTDWDRGNAVGATFKVVIHDGATVSDPVLGTSLVATAAADLLHEFVHFDFASPVPLTPGLPHTVEVFQLSGDAFRLNGLYPGFYAGGQMNTNSSGDLYFRTGQVPEPSSSLLIALGGIALVRRRRSRKACASAAHPGESRPAA